MPDSPAEEKNSSGPDWIAARAPPQDSSPEIEFRKIAGDLWNRICGSSMGGRPKVLRDMMVGTRDQFDYYPCGAGWLLEAREPLRFRRLLGVDPFPLVGGRRGKVTPHKKDISDVDLAEVIDLMILHLSLEHVPDPIGILGTVRQHLSAGGLASGAMPIVGEAHRAYGTNAFQLDPPRHFHIFSVKGFEIADARSSLQLAGSYFNPTAAQFGISEEHSRDKPSNRHGLSLVRPISSLPTEGHNRARARTLNRPDQGGQAVFYFRRNRQWDEAS